MSVNPVLVNNLWLSFNFAGQWCLLGLILTYIFVPSIPQRKNPFLFNLLLTTYFATIPGSLLFETILFILISNSDYFYQCIRRQSPKWGKSFLGSSLLFSGSPHRWMSALPLTRKFIDMVGNTCFSYGEKTDQSKSNVHLLIAPYFCTWIFVFGSFIAAAQSKANHSLISAYCQNYSYPSNRLRTAVGNLMLGIVLIEIGFGIAIGWTMFRNRKLLKMDPVRWRNEKHFVTRLFILNALQLIALLLSAINIADGLALFFTIGTQKQIINTWITIITRRKMPEFVGTHTITLSELPYSDELVPDYDIERNATPTSQGYGVQAKGGVADKPNEFLGIDLLAGSSIPSVLNSSELLQPLEDPNINSVFSSTNTCWNLQLGHAACHEAVTVFWNTVLGTRHACPSALLALPPTIICYICMSVMVDSYMVVAITPHRSSESSSRLRLFTGGTGHQALKREAFPQLYHSD
ncbi:hypothetical protein BU17DRAFT_71400 [Hysterangium stoloniferum]|nr:hypothetical protein BU17DRAFT_71400 [Hysterangium stoloniferum]